MRPQVISERFTVFADGIAAAGIQAALKHMLEGEVRQKRTRIPAAARPARKVQQAYYTRSGKSYSKAVGLCLEIDCCAAFA